MISIIYIHTNYKLYVQLFYNFAEHTVRYQYILTYKKNILIYFNFSQKCKILWNVQKKKKNIL